MAKKGFSLLYPKLDTKENAIAFLKELRKQGVRIYFLDHIGRLVINPRNKRRMSFGPSIAKHITELLEIKSKEDWERIKKLL